MTVTISPERYYMLNNGKMDLATEPPLNARTIFATETTTSRGIREIRLSKHDGNGAFLEAEVYPLYIPRLVSSHLCSAHEAMQGTFFGYSIQGRVYSSASTQPEGLIQGFEQVLSAFINLRGGKLDKPDLHTQELESTTVTRFRWRQVKSLDSAPSPLLDDHTHFVVGFAIPCK